MIYIGACAYSKKHFHIQALKNAHKHMHFLLGLPVPEIKSAPKRSAYSVIGQTAATDRANTNTCVDVRPYALPGPWARPCQVGP